MNQLILSIHASVHAHPVLWGLGSYVIASNMVTAMPDPGEKSSAFYRWSFNVLHGVLLQAGRFVAGKFPQLGQNGNGK